MKLVRAIIVGVLMLVAAFAQAGIGLVARLQPTADPNAIAAQFSIDYIDHAAGSDFHYFYLKDDLQVHTLIAAMLIHPGIVWVEDDKEFIVPESTNGKGSSIPQLRKQNLLVLYSPNAGYAENSQWLNRIGWSYEKPVVDRRVRVAVLDTGLSPHQPSLWTNVVADMSAIPRETRGYDLKSHLRSTRRYDANGALGHGTMVTSLIAQLAPDAELVICRVADSAGFSNSWRIIKGLAFAVLYECELANVSLGSYENIPAINDVLDWTETKGLQVVGAIGNDNVEDAMHPARNNKVICVTGVDPDDKKALFSNWEGRSDMAAPATGIRGANWDGNMLIWHGTSFAAPIVTGCLAEALKNREPMLPELLREAIDGVGTNINPLNPQYADKLGPRIHLPSLRNVLRP